MAYNRIDRYISIRYKGLGATKVDIYTEDIRKDNDFTCKVKSIKDTILSTQLILKIGHVHVHVALAERGIQVENHVNINMLLQKSMT